MKNRNPSLFLALWCLIPLLMGARLGVCGEPPALRVVSEDAEGLHLLFRLPVHTIRHVEQENGDIRTEIEVPGGAWTDEGGAPRLPVISALVQAPEACAVSVDVLEAQCRDMGRAAIGPTPGLALSPDGERVAATAENPEIYQANRFFPEPLAVAGPVQRLRGTAVCRITARPFQWNPVTGRLRGYETLSLRLRFTPLGEDAEDAGSRRRSQPVADPPAFDALKHRVILNYQPPAGTSGISETARRSLEKEDPEEDGLRLEIGETGVYRIPFSRLAEAGLSLTGISPLNFKLFNQGEETAINVDTEAGHIEFYGRNLNNRHTGTNVYWLYWGQGAGRRMARQNAAPSGSGLPTDRFTHVLHVEKNTDFWALTPGAAYLDYWFWTKFTAPQSQTYALQVPNPAPIDGPAKVAAHFQGRSTAMPHPNHHTRVSLNGEMIGDEFWDWQNPHTQVMDIRQNRLKPGANSLVVNCPGDTGAVVDIVYLNWVEITYERELKADNGALGFSLPADGLTHEIQVTGFTTPDILVFDVTRPTAPERLENFRIQAQNGGYAATFEAIMDVPRSFFAADAGAFQTPSRASLRPASALSALKDGGQGADYLIITDPSLAQAATPLADLRRKQGMRVRVITATDIVDAFNHGIFDPAAIRECLIHAYQYWPRPAPSHVLLLGDATIDYRNDYGLGKQNLAPVHFGVTTALGLTPDDNWYVCVDGGEDVLPDMMVGRIPGANPAAVSAVIAKIISYEADQTYQPKTVLFAADNEAGFENLNNSLAARLAPGFSAAKVYLGRYGGNTAQAKSDLMAGINAGALITTYVGHGSLTNWAGEFLFQSSDVSALNNAGKLTFVTDFDCINGYFAHPGRYSLNEAFVLAAGKGAVAGFGPSGLGLPWEHQMLSTALFDAVFKNGDNRAGRIATQAKIQAYAQGVSADILPMFNLSGDPATLLKVDLPGVKGDVDGDGEVDLRDAVLALQISANLPVPFPHPENALAGGGRIGLAEALHALRTAGHQP